MDPSPKPDAPAAPESAPADSTSNNDNNNKLFCANPGDADTPLGRAADAAGWLVGHAQHLLRTQLPDFSPDAVRRFVTAPSWEQRLQILVTPIATDPYTLQRLVRSLCGDFFVAGGGSTAIIRGFDTFMRASTALGARGKRTCELFYRTTKGSAFTAEPRRYGACPFGEWEARRDAEPHVVARDVFPAQAADIERMVDDALAAKVGGVVEAGDLFNKLVWELIVFTTFGVPPGPEVEEQRQLFIAAAPAFDRSLRVGTSDRAGEWDDELTAQHAAMQAWSSGVVRARKAALDAGGAPAADLLAQSDILTHTLKSARAGAALDVDKMTGALHAVFLAGYVNMHCAITGAVVANALQDDAVAAYVAQGTDGDGDDSVAARVDHVVRETLRVHTAVPATRVVQEADDFALGDAALKAGGQVVLTTFGVNTDPRSWGEDADAFKPARFAGKADELGFYCQEGFAPFGAAAEQGGRPCSGRFYVVHVMRTVLGKVLRDYKLEKVGKKGFFDFKQLSASSMYIGKCDVHVQRRRK